MHHKLCHYYCIYITFEADSVDEDPMKELVFWEVIAAFSTLSLECAIRRLTNIYIVMYT